MPSRIEIHDSVCDRLVKPRDGIVIDLKPAIVHRSAGQPGVDFGQVFASDVQLRFHHAFTANHEIKTPIDLADGEVMIGEIRLKNLVPLPFSTSKELTANLIDVMGNELKINAIGLTIIEIGNERFLEHFPGTKN